MVEEQLVLEDPQEICTQFTCFTGTNTDTEEEQLLLEDPKDISGNYEEIIIEFGYFTSADRVMLTEYYTRHTSAYLSMRQHASVCVSMRQHTYADAC